MAAAVGFALPVLAISAVAQPASGVPSGQPWGCTPGGFGPHVERIGLIESIDHGATWELKGHACINTPSLNPVDPSALFDSGELVLYFFDLLSFNSPTHTFAIYKTIASDAAGLQFSAPAQAFELTGTEFTDPAVIRLPGGEYRMYLHTSDGIISATSSDGKNFTADPGIRTNAGGVPGAMVLPDGRVRLFVSSQGITSLISDDGLDFTPEPGVRIPIPAGAVIVADPHPILCADGIYRMAYKVRPSGPGGPEIEDVYLAESTDALSWTPGQSALVKGSVPTLVELPDGRLRIYFVDFNYNPGLSLLLGTNGSGVYHAGETVTVSAGVNNPGAAATVDFFFGILLPDTHTILFFKNLAFGLGAADISNLAAMTPFLAGVNLSVPFSFAAPDLFSYQWNGNEPGGSYTFFLLAALPGALADNAIDPGDLLALGTATVSFSSSIYRFIRTVQVAPDSDYLIGGFVRVGYVPATERLAVTFGTRLAQPAAGCIDSAHAYKEYTLDLQPSGHSGVLNCETGDSNGLVVGNTYYDVSMHPVAGPDGWRIGKYDAVTWDELTDVLFPLDAPREGSGDMMLALVNGQLDISSGYTEAGGPPAPDQGGGTHHQFFTPDLQFLGERILTDIPHIGGSSLIYVDGAYYFITATAFTGDLIMMKYDENWQYLGMKELIRQAHWSTGVAFDGQRFHIAYLDTSQRTEPVFFPFYPNVHLAAFDRDWNLVDDVAVTDFAPDTEFTGRPSVHLHGNRLYVSYDMAPIDPITHVENLDEIKAIVSIYELTQSP